MSVNETVGGGGRAGSDHPPARIAGESSSDRLKHAGLSVLPLALFVSGVLGYEQVKASFQARPATPAAAASAPGPVAVKVPVVAATRTAPAAHRALQLEDTRNLLELVRAAETTARPRAEPRSTRNIAHEIGAANRTSLAIVANTKLHLPTCGSTCYLIYVSLC